jgi:hypothetical protein
MLRDLFARLREFTSRSSEPEPLDVEDLQREAQRAWDRYNGSQTELGEELGGIDRSAISRAVRHVGKRHVAVQAKIISHVREEPVERRSTYRGSEVKHRWILGPREEPVSGA